MTGTKNQEMDILHLGPGVNGHMKFLEHKCNRIIRQIIINGCRQNSSQEYFKNMLTKFITYEWTKKILSSPKGRTWLSLYKLAIATLILQCL